MKRSGTAMGVILSVSVFILGAAMLLGGVFSLNYGVSSFTPPKYDSGFAMYSADLSSYLTNNTAAIAAHVNNLYKTIVKLSGIFLMVLGAGGVCLFSALGSDDSPKTISQPTESANNEPAYNEPVYDDKIPEI